ncbi:MAG: hypothetical protein ABIG11_00935 [bacterium]
MDLYTIGIQDPEYAEGPQCHTRGAFCEKRSCEKLWAAVLMRAWDDANGDLAHHAYRSTKRRIIDQARAWFMSDSRIMPSFLWICETLELDPGHIRSKVRQVIIDGDRERQRPAEYLLPALQ